MLMGTICICLCICGFTESCDGLTTSVLITMCNDACMIRDVYAKPLCINTLYVYAYACPHGYTYVIAYGSAYDYAYECECDCVCLCIRKMHMQMPTKYACHDAYCYVYDCEYGYAYDSE